MRLPEWGERASAKTRVKRGARYRCRERCGGHATKGCITWLSRGWETEVEEDRDARSECRGEEAEGIKKKVGKTAGRKLRRIGSLNHLGERELGVRPIIRPLASAPRLASSRLASTLLGGG